MTQRGIFFKEIWSNRNIRRLIIFFVVVVFVLIGFLFYQYNKVNREIKLKVQFIEEKNMLRDDLDDLIDEHDELLDEYGHLNEQLHGQDSLIQQQISEIRNLLRVKNNLNEAKRKIMILRKISRRYLANIDSVLVLNERLSIEKDSVVRVNKNINWKNYKLNKENKKLSEKVDIGSIINVYDIEVEAIRYKSTGRELTTKYASKVQKLRVCFTVEENHVADAENKEIFLQYINENGEVLHGSDSALTVLNGKKIVYTMKSTFEYENNKMDICIDWQRVEILTKGDFLLNIIIEDKIVGSNQFKLR